MPHIETMIVAIFNDRTKGARLMAPAKMIWLIIQAVIRSGLYWCRLLTKGAILLGGRGVNPGFS